MICFNLPILCFSFVCFTFKFKILLSLNKKSFKLEGSLIGKEKKKEKKENIIRGETWTFIWVLAHLYIRAWFWWILSVPWNHQHSNTAQKGKSLHLSVPRFLHVQSGDNNLVPVRVCCKDERCGKAFLHSLPGPHQMFHKYRLLLLCGADSLVIISGWFANIIVALLKSKQTFLPCLSHKVY